MSIPGPSTVEVPALIVGAGPAGLAGEERRDTLRKAIELSNSEDPTPVRDPQHYVGGEALGHPERTRRQT